ncbi:MAG: hypothetical protein C0506_07790 [Anaerolinea sp.]|nr:hypothetical protein [Anaerolinea sp.]
MADQRFDPATRSRNMAAIRSKDTGIEMQVRRALHAAGFRFRLHRKDLPGKPDIVLPRYRTAVFVNGCFWHGHDCIEGHTPKSNTAYVESKDRRRILRSKGGRVTRRPRPSVLIGFRRGVLSGCLHSRDLGRVSGERCNGHRVQQVDGFPRGFDRSRRQAAVLPQGHHWLGRCAGGDRALIGLRRAALGDE